MWAVEKVLKSILMARLKIKSSAANVSVLSSHVHCSSTSAFGATVRPWLNYKDLKILKKIKI